jgi:hypothetical protein
MKFWLQSLKNIFDMSKKNILFVFVTALMLVFASCKTHERCPAYGKVNTTKSHNFQPA